MMRRSVRFNRVEYGTMGIGREVSNVCMRRVVVE